jgi:hypothetical protein
MRKTAFALCVAAAALLGVPAAASAETTSYKNCDAVRKAGKAPLSKGEPGYGTHLDDDKDGVACEDGATARRRPGSSTTTRKPTRATKPEAVKAKPRFTG